MQSLSTPLRLPSLAAFLLLASAPVAAQATALVREGEEPPGAPAGQITTSLSNSAVNQTGGFAVSLNTSDGGATLSHLFGDPLGSGTATVLRTEGVFGSLSQTSFESFFGLDDAGSLAYSASCDDLVSGATSLDSTWIDGTVLALEDEPITSLPGKIWRFASRPGITADGSAYWVGGINDAISGSSEGNGLFADDGLTVLVKTGDLVPPLIDPVGASGVDFDARLSAAGTHWITKVTTDGPTTNDEFVVLDGSVLTVSGGLVGEGELVPISSGGNGVDAWDNFDFFGVTESGTVLFTGDTDGDTTSDEFIARDGVIVYREGDSVDDAVLTGALEGAFMNEAGDIGYIWDIEDGSGGSLEALFFEDRLLLVEGALVDWDGDGFVDAGHVLENFTGISALTLGSDQALYFTADVDVPVLGTLEALFRFRYDGFKADSWSISASSGGTQTLDVDAGSDNAGLLYGVMGSLSGTSPGFTFKGVEIPLVPDAYLTQTLTQANSANFVTTFGFLDADGRATASIVVPVQPALAGETAHHTFLAFSLGPIDITKVGEPVSLVILP